MYKLINKQKKLDKYATPIPKKIFDTIGYAKVFSTLDLKSRFYQLPITLETNIRQYFEV